MEYLPTFIDQLDADYISHHGIKGMHWGIRRYQNTDGSYTSAGKARYNSNQSNSKRSFSKSKAAKIAAGAAITAAGVAALAYMNNSDLPTISDKIAEKAVGNYCKTARKAAGDLYDETVDTFKACEKAFYGDWPSIDAKTCRINAKRVIKDANDMFQAYSKSRVPFVDKAWRNSAGTSRRSKARADINRTDEAISNYRNAMLEYADIYDSMAKELDRRRGNKLSKRQDPMQRYEDRAAEARAQQKQKWAKEKAARKAREEQEQAARLEREREAARERAKQERQHKEWEEWDRVYNR